MTKHLGRLRSKGTYLLFVSCLVFASPSFAECIAMDAEAKASPSGATLNRLFPQLTPGSYQIVFFATWCHACKIALDNPSFAQAILVGTLDEREAIGRAYTQFGKSRLCLFDAQGTWLKALGKGTLPFSTRLDISAQSAL